MAGPIEVDPSDNPAPGFIVKAYALVTTLQQLYQLAGVGVVVAWIEQ